MKFNSLVEAVAFYAEDRPGKVCLIESENGNSLTYGEFWKRIKVFAKRLKDAGLQKGSRVAVRVGGLVDTFVAEFGVFLAGGVYCPLEKNMKAPKMLEMLEYFDSAILISSERIDFNGAWFDLRQVRDDGEELGDFTFPEPDDMCAIIFTTGTTGKAKGVVVSFRTNLNVAKAHSHVFGFTENDVFYSVNPLDRSAGVRMAGQVFIVGGTFVHLGGVAFVKDFFDSLETYHINYVYIPASSLAIILNAGADEFKRFRDKIKLMFFGAGAMPESHKKQMTALLPKTKLFLNYGSTETSVISCCEFSLYPNKPNCVGKLYPNTELVFVDSDGSAMEAASKDNLGIVSCKTECMMQGYWKAPELTRDTIKNGFVIMTDMGYIGSDGFLYLMGRRDDVITSGGHKIAPYEIEDVAMQIPGILECACVSQKDKLLGLIPVLFVVMKDGAEFSAKNITNYIVERIESYKTPRKVIQLDAMPRLSNNKISRKDLSAYE